MSTPPLTQRLFIDGAFTDGAGTETFDVISPVTGEHVGTIPLLVQADLDAAVAAARVAQRAWAAVNVWERAAEALIAAGVPKELVNILPGDGAYPCAGQVRCATERVLVDASVHSSPAAKRRTGMPTDLYYEFTVVDGVPADSLLSREESFGPVMPIITGRGEDDLLRIANDDKLGLQGAVFTRSMTSAFCFIEDMEVGQVVDA